MALSGLAKFAIAAAIVVVLVILFLILIGTKCYGISPQGSGVWSQQQASGNSGNSGSGS